MGDETSANHTMIEFAFYHPVGAVA